MIFTDLCPHCNQPLEQVFGDYDFHFICFKSKEVNRDWFHDENINFSSLYRETNYVWISYPLDINNKYMIQFYWNLVKNKRETIIYFSNRKVVNKVILELNYFLDTSYAERDRLLTSILKTQCLI